MNIFYLHQVASAAAEMHCDKHVGKMLIETCQLLATAHHTHGNGLAVSYRPTHVNHPCALWVRSSKLHYEWTVKLGRGLGLEFQARYGRFHKSHQVLIEELTLAPPQLTQTGWIDPPLVMPDSFKGSDPIESYRHYYASKSQTMPMTYYRGTIPPPDWLWELWRD